jgi:hypothetical protein
VSASTELSFWQFTDVACPEVSELRSRGVGFVFAAWLVDPDGNSIGLLQFKCEETR